MSEQKYMTPAQGRRHYHDWLASGMTQNNYARFHDIHTKTVDNFCRDIATKTARMDAPKKTTFLPQM